MLRCVRDPLSHGIHQNPTALADCQPCIRTFKVYLGSSIYAPSVGGIIEETGNGDISASLGLALYVLGCILAREDYLLALADMYLEMVLDRCCYLH